VDREGRASADGGALGLTPPVKKFAFFEKLPNRKVPWIFPRFGRAPGKKPALFTNSLQNRDSFQKKWPDFDKKM